MVPIYLSPIFLLIMPFVGFSFSCPMVQSRILSHPEVLCPLGCLQSATAAQAFFTFHDIDIWKSISSYFAEYLSNWVCLIFPHDRFPLCGFLCLFNPLFWNPPHFARPASSLRTVPAAWIFLVRTASLSELAGLWEGSSGWLSLAPGEDLEGNCRTPEVSMPLWPIHWGLCPAFAGSDLRYLLLPLFLRPKELCLWKTKQERK